MDKKLFADLVASVKEMQEIRAGKREPGGVTPGRLQSVIAEGLASCPPIEITQSYWKTKHKKLGA